VIAICLLQYYALQKILELEMKDRKASDEKCSLLIEQNTELTNEILILRSELLTLNDRFSKLSDFNDRLMCKSSIIDSMNMTEIEDLEKQLTSLNESGIDFSDSKKLLESLIR
jgi:hypothetical protein